MSDKKNCVVIGYSGQGYVVVDLAISCQYKVKFYSERAEALSNPYQLQYIGYEKDENFAGWNKGYQFLLGIGDNKIREQIAKLLLSKKESVLSIVHPTAAVATKVSIDAGVVIARNVTINPLAEIGAFSMLNTGCIVEHECKIGAAVHVAPGAVLTGNVKVGDRSFIGANAVIKQGISIGNDVVIGAGSVVIRDVPDNEVWAGNPARRLRK